MNTSKKLLTSCCMILATATAAQAALDVGVLQIIGYNADGNDGLSFVTWTDLAAGTAFGITDQGWSTVTNALFSDPSNDSAQTWTNDTGATIAAGTVIRIENDTADLGSISGAFNVNTSGDQFFIYEGTQAAPLFVNGIDFSDDAGWATSVADDVSSGLPDVLNTANGNLGFAHTDNGWYDGPRTGMSIADFQTEIADLTNWTLTSSSTELGLGLSSVDFSIVPEPSTYAMMLGFVALGVAARRRSRK